MKLKIRSRSRNSPRKSAELARYILTSLDDDIDDQHVAAEWRKEVARRLDEIDGGQITGTPAEQLFRELRDQYS